MNSILRKIIFSTVFILPFIILPYTSYSMVFPKSLFLEGVTLIIGALWIIGKLLKKEKETEKIPRNIVFLVFGVYIFFLLISALGSFVPGLSFWGTLDHGTGAVFMLCLFVFSIITSSVLKKIEDWYKLFTIFIISGLFFNIGTFLSEMGVHFSSIPINASGGFLIGNSSWAGVYLAFVFFISLGMIFSPSTKNRKIIAVLGLVTTFFNPIITGFIIPAPDQPFRLIGLARASLYSIFAGTGFFVVYLFFRKIISQKWRKICIGIFITIFIAIPLFIVIRPDVFRQGISATAGPNRLIFWDIAVSSLKEHPVLGWGGDTYQFAYAKYFNPVITFPGYSPEYWADRAHSIYFDELHAGGFVGFILLMSLYIIILFGLLRNGIKQKDENNILFMALSASLMSFLIQGLLLFQTIIGWFIISMIIAFIANFCFKDRNIINSDVNGNNKKNTDKDNTFRNLFLVIIIVIFGFLFNYLVIKPYQISHGLAKFPIMSYEKRMAFYKELDSGYMGNTTDLGNVFLPYHIRLRQILKKGLKDEEKKLMINEIKEINRILDNGLKRQDYKELKILMGMTGFYSVIIALTDGQESKDYYDQSMFYVEKMKMASPKSPIPEISKALLDISLNYGEEGLDLLNLDKDKVQKRN